MAGTGLAPHSQVQLSEPESEPPVAPRSHHTASAPTAYCLKGHLLLAEHAPDVASCSRCHQRLQQKDVILRCSQCSFNICMECRFKPSTQEASPLDEFFEERKSVKGDAQAIGDLPLQSPTLAEHPPPPPPPLPPPPPPLPPAPDCQLPEQLDPRVWDRDVHGPATSGMDMLRRCSGRFSVADRCKQISGSYLFDKTVGALLDFPTYEWLATFSCNPISEARLDLPSAKVAGKQKLRCIKLKDSSIISEIQASANSSAFFVIPSQFNGVSYPLSSQRPFHRAVDMVVENYRHTHGGGPRAQLAVHPAVGQFLLDNAANAWQPDGINMIDGFLKVAKTHTIGFEFSNGLLVVPAVRRDAQKHVIEFVRSQLHRLRVLVMDDVPACGLGPDGAQLSDAEHKVSLAYISPVPIDMSVNKCNFADQEPFQIQVAEFLLAGQYYGAMKAAARAETEPGTRTKVFLMPAGSGASNVPEEAIAQSISVAVEMLSPEERGKLDITLLTWKDNPGEFAEWETLLREHNKLEAVPPPPPAKAPVLQDSADSAAGADDDQTKTLAIDAAHPDEVARQTKAGADMSAAGAYLWLLDWKDLDEINLDMDEQRGEYGSSEEVADHDEEDEEDDSLAASDPDPSIPPSHPPSSDQLIGQTPSLDLKASDPDPLMPGPLANPPSSDQLSRQTPSPLRPIASDPHFIMPAPPPNPPSSDQLSRQTPSPHRSIASNPVTLVPSPPPHPPSSDQLSRKTPSPLRPGASDPDPSHLRPSASNPVTLVPSPPPHPPSSDQLSRKTPSPLRPSASDPDPSPLRPSASDPDPLMPYPPRPPSSDRRTCKTPSPSPHRLSATSPGPLVPSPPSHPPPPEARIRQQEEDRYDKCDSPLTPSPPSYPPWSSTDSRARQPCTPRDRQPRTPRDGPDCASVDPRSRQPRTPSPRVHREPSSNGTRRRRRRKRSRSRSYRNKLSVKKKPRCAIFMKRVIHGSSSSSHTKANPLDEFFEKRPAVNGDVEASTITDFIEANKLDAEAATALKNSRPEVQTLVLSGGAVKKASNSSRVVISRIAQAKKTLKKEERHRNWSSREKKRRRRMEDIPRSVKLRRTMLRRMWKEKDARAAPRSGASKVTKRVLSHAPWQCKRAKRSKVTDNQ